MLYSHMPASNSSFTVCSDNAVSKPKSAVGKWGRAVKTCSHLYCTFGTRVWHLCNFWIPILPGFGNPEIAKRHQTVVVQRWTIGSLGRSPSHLLMASKHWTACCSCNTIQTIVVENNPLQSMCQGSSTYAPFYGASSSYRIRFFVPHVSSLHSKKSAACLKLCSGWFYCKWQVTSNTISILPLMSQQTALAPSFSSHIVVTVLSNYQELRNSQDTHVRTQMPLVSYSEKNACFFGSLASNIDKLPIL